MANVGKNLLSIQDRLRFECYGGVLCEGFYWLRRVWLYIVMSTENDV